MIKSPDDSSMDKRSILIETTQQLIEANGYHQTSLQQIADSAQITQAELSSLFRKKATLASEVMKSCLKKQNDQVLSLPYNKGISPEQNLINFVQSLQHYLKHQESDFIVFTLLSLEPRVFKNNASEHLKQWIETIDLFLKPLHTNHETQELAQLSLVILVGSAVCWHLRKENSLRPVHFMDTLFKLWMTGSPKNLVS